MFSIVEKCIKYIFSLTERNKNQFIKKSLFWDNENPRAIDFCLRTLKKNYDQIVDIVRYLSKFMNDKQYSKIILESINL